MIGCSYLRLSKMSLIMNVPKVSMKADLIGSIMPPQRASAAKGEIFASASAVG